MTTALSWDGLTVTTGAAGGRRNILDRLSGSVGAGQLLAVMGPTGSGKTTFLNSVAHRLDADLEYSGKVRFGGQAWTKDRKSQLGFVEQDDIVIDVLTVRQSLRFVAELRLPHAMPLAARVHKIDAVVRRLRLQKCLDSKVSDISGGERKRLCIAQELIVEPQLILLDEPTSGLDSTTAKLVVEYLEELAGARDHSTGGGGGVQASPPLTIVATIHQPSSQIFHMFDNLLLLADGKTVFRGASKRAAPYFGDKLGFPCPMNYNPADHFMDLVVLGKLEDPRVRRTLEEDFTTGAKPCAGATEAAAAAAAAAIIASGGGGGGGEGWSGDNINYSGGWTRYARPWRTQVWILSRRMWLVEQNAQFTVQNVILYLGLAVICAVLWVRIGFEESDIFKRSSLCFWLTGTWTFFPLFNALFLFGMDRTLVGKELSINSYRLSAYYVAKSLVSLPAFFIWAWVYHIIVHFVTGLNDSFLSYLCLYLSLMLNILACQGIGLLISAGISQEYILTSCILCVTAMFSYGGFFVPVASMDPLYRWVVYIDPINYAFRLVTGVVFGPNLSPLDFNCAGANDTVYPASCGGAANAGRRLITGERVLEEIGTGDMQMWVAALALVAFAVVTRSAAYLMLRWKWVIQVQQKEMVEVAERDTPSRPARVAAMTGQKSGVDEAGIAEVEL